MSAQARELEEFCFKFSLNHMTAVTQTEAFAKLDEGTVKDFITKVLPGRLADTLHLTFPAQAALSGAFKS